MEKKMFLIVKKINPTMDIILNSEDIGRLEPVLAGAGGTTIYTRTGDNFNVVNNIKDLWDALKPQTTAGSSVEKLIQNIIGTNGVQTTNGLGETATVTVATPIPAKTPKIAWNKGLTGVTKSKAPAVVSIVTDAVATKVVPPEDKPQSGTRSAGMLT